MTKFSDDIKVQTVCDALNRHGIGQYVRFVRELERERNDAMSVNPQRHQISVVYPCCGAQEYWPLTDRDELEMNHTDLGAHCGEYTGTYHDRLDALRRLADVFVPAGVNVQLTPSQREALDECYRIGALL